MLAVIGASLLLMSNLSLFACAAVPKDPQARAEYNQNDDPAEPINRKIFAANEFVDHHALRPVARGYEEYVPSHVRVGVHNFISNLGQPSIALNDVLQGNFKRAWNTTQRFTINTTIGGAGVFDVATGWNRPAHDADFGETLGVWGIGPRPAVQLPLFGPSNIRDSVGKVVGFLTNPVTFVPGGTVDTVNTASSGVGIVDMRAELLKSTDALERNSLDYYSALRSVQAQRRAALVADGKRGSVGPPPTVSTNPAVEEPVAIVVSTAPQMATISHP
jgi:phospholipid-binding lipoprotein MlaA